MTKNEALQTFFSGFGLTAYPAGTDTEDREYPWLTYENVIGNAGDIDVSITVQLWYHTDSEKIPNAKADEIAQAIGRGGRQVPYADGTIWIKRGQPWCNALSDENDPAVKGRALNIELQFN